MNFIPTDVPTGVSQFGNLDGPFPELAGFPLVVRSFPSWGAVNAK